MLIRVDRLSKAGYHSVFAMAIGLLVLDIILRMGMIEQKTASKWLQNHREGETEGLLRASADDSCSQQEVARDRPDRAPTEQASEAHSDGEPTSNERTGSVPGIVRLLLSGNMLAVLLAALVHSSFGASFDTVSFSSMMPAHETTDHHAQVLPVYVLRTFHWGPFLIGLCFIPLCIPSFFAPIVGTYDHASCSN